MGDRLAHLVREHTAFGDHDQVEALGDAGIDFDTLRHRLERRHRHAEPTAQSLRFGLLGRQPLLLQRCHDAAIAHHGAEQRHRFVDSADAQLGFAEPFA